MKVIKRNGSEVDFDSSKISAAVMKANLATGDHMSELGFRDIVVRIVDKCEQLNRAVSVEEIQDMVEKELMAAGWFEVAQHYIRYRYQRMLARKSSSLDDQIINLIECNNEVIKQENSNKDPIINSVQRDYMAGELSRDISNRLLLPKEIVDAHNEGIIHFHDTDYFAQHMHNCFSGGTRFITSEGIRTFRDCKDGSKVFVLTKEGLFREATVRKYEKQHLFDVTLKNARQTKTVTCTRDHRWIKKDGSVTTSLKVGDILFALREIGPDRVHDYEWNCAWCIGFILGDGCDHGQVAEVKLCGHKVQYESRFINAGYKIASSNGMMCAYKKGISKQEILNAKAWKYMTLKQRQALFNGLYCADGSTKANKLCTADARIAELIEDISAVAGYHISSHNVIVHNTNYKKGAILHEFRFVTHHRDNWCWKVDKIRPHHKNESNLYDVWCVEEPITHSFTLEGGIVTGNCDLVNIEDMLQNGTVISGTMIEKPHSFSTACNIATQIIAQVASNQYGGQSISLAHLAPFVNISRQNIREDVLEEMRMAGATVSHSMIDAIVEKRVRQEIRRGVQTIQYQVITLMTTNGQAPFLTVFMYLGEAKNDQERKDLAMIIEETLIQRHEGVKNEKGVWITPAFPKLIYVLEECNTDPNGEYYALSQLAAKCTAKRMVPDYISEKKMKELKEGNCFPVMGCRSALNPWKNEKGEYQFYGRFNQGVVTINLPDVALSSGGNMEKFWKIFDERLELCYRGLMCRHERLKGTLSDAAPILWQHGALARLEKGEPIDKLLYGGYSSISLGYAGLHECVMAMLGKPPTDPEATPFALQVMRYMNQKCDEWKQRTNIGFSLYGTPIESTTYKFAKCLQRRFGIVPGVTDRGYITNSYHIHVTKQIDAFSKLAFEAQFQELSTGGAVSYVEVPNLERNLDVIMTLQRFIYDHIMYAELNTKSDYCQVCGYSGEIQLVDENGKWVWECPNCKNRNQDKMNVARRTCGYIGTQFWNQGRTQEIKDRQLHL